MPSRHNAAEGDRPKPEQPLWKTCGKPVEKTPKSGEKPVENLWKTDVVSLRPVENSVENLWKTCGKLLEAVDKVD
jgi:hypothetical protein